MAPLYTGTVTAQFTATNLTTLDGLALQFSGLPADAKNLKATVSYSAGRGAGTEYLTPVIVDPKDDDIDAAYADITDGKISFVAGSVTNQAGTTQDYGTPKEGTTYSVVFSCDNYIINTLGVTYTADGVVLENTSSSATKSAGIKASKTSVKYSTLKRKAQTVTITVSGSKGKITASNVSSKKIKKNLSLKTSGRKVTATFKKGAAKGTYKVKVSVAAKGNYKKTSKTISIKVK